ncbi:PilT protein domain protein [Dehalogenimonas lykanthroporepellens BL-DC-9]|nr:PilT protein domain protein [Dehalogenimonas lykanthroporepellens BL-DC-9]
MTGNPEPKEYVLDSFALLAYLEGEPGTERVVELLTRAEEKRYRLFMSVINLGEVVYIVERERGLAKSQKILARIDELPITIVDADRTAVLGAAHLKAGCPVAYADCFAAALALDSNAVLVTGDPEFGRISERYGLEVEWMS